MSDLAARLDRACKAAGYAIEGVSIGRRTDRTTWTVQPPALQAACQPIIDAFNPDDPAHEAAELTREATRLLDTERMISAMVWAMLDAQPQTAAVTLAKYNALRAKIITAFISRPWNAST